jgi:hypothetical protein
MSCHDKLEETFGVEDDGPESFDFHPSLPPSPAVDVIETKLNFGHKLNKRLPWLDHPDYQAAFKMPTQSGRRIAKKLARLKWGKEQQAFAKNAKECSTLNELKKEVSSSCFLVLFIVTDRNGS